MKVSKKQCIHKSRTCAICHYGNNRKNEYGDMPGAKKKIGEKEIEIKEEENERVRRN